MPPKFPPRISQETVTRRSWLEWVGGAAVLGLGSGLLKACATLDASAGEDAAHPDEGVPPADGRSDAVTAEGGTDGDREVAAGEFPFDPGPRRGSVFEDWGERTVDRQELQQILDSWRLRVDGFVEAPFELSFAELVALPRQDQVTDFHCVEGWSIYDVPWNGVHLSTLLERARPSARASYVTFHTIGDRYNESLPLPVALEPRTLLAYGINGSTLPFVHGFPLRLVVPRLLAYKSAKYVARIELTDRPVEGFWVAAGYPYDGIVPPGRLREGKY